MEAILKTGSQTQIDFSKIKMRTFSKVLTKKGECIKNVAFLTNFEIFSTGLENFFKQLENFSKHIENFFKIQKRPGSASFSRR